VTEQISCLCFKSYILWE